MSSKPITSNIELMAFQRKQGVKYLLEVDWSESFVSSTVTFEAPYEFLDQSYIVYIRLPLRKAIWFSKMRDGRVTASLDASIFDTILYITPTQKMGR